MSMPVIIPSETTRDQAISDIIESVALQEAGLAHIINAEGEKIQKVVATTANVNELLAVNKSVENMLITVSRLEVLLQSKLALFNLAYEPVQP